MTPPSNFKDLVSLFINIINPILLLLAGFSLLVFFWGLASFIFKSGDTKAIADGKELMKWGLIALFVMVSLWGIINFFYGSFGFSGVLGIPLLPTR